MLIDINGFTRCFLVMRSIYGRVIFFLLMQAYDPFEYMTALAQRHEEINQDFEDEEESKGGKEEKAQQASIPPPPPQTPTRNPAVKKVII